MTSRALGSEIRNRLSRSPQAVLPIARGVRPGQEHLFPLAAHLLNAEDDRARCAQLVRLPDCTVLSHGGVMAQACMEAGFGIGADYLQVRMAALTARRDGNGDLPAATTAQLRFWTEFMAGQARVRP